MNTEARAKSVNARVDAVSRDGALALRALGLPLDAKILDVGTSNGKFAIYLASQGFQVLTGEPNTDTSHYAGKNWEANAEKAGVRDLIRFQAFDASQLPFESKSFDAVFFFGVLHHIDQDLREEVMREALRVAKDGGAVVFFEPRTGMLENIRVDDPSHPAAADPSSYLHDSLVARQRIDGDYMDIFIYRNPNVALLAASQRTQPVASHS